MPSRSHAPGTHSVFPGSALVRRRWRNSYKVRPKLSRGPSPVGYHPRSIVDYQVGKFCLIRLRDDPRPQNTSPSLCRPSGTPNCLGAVQSHMHRRLGVAARRGVKDDERSRRALESRPDRAQGLRTRRRYYLHAAHLKWHAHCDPARSVADGPILAIVEREAFPFLSQLQPETDRGSRIQLLAIVLVTLLVMVLGVLVVVAPDRMGVPQPIATPATPTANDE
jgi:hypothetical protein